jgi:ADP-dependent NAD(P)H-hydrate dehydratase / NAD(P)H-hydrate epimerase
MTGRYYTAAAIRGLERSAIEHYHIPGFELMQRAGAAAFAALRRRWPGAKRVLVFCGTGNNGGDGFIIAALAKEAGFAVDAYLVGAEEKIRGDARKAYERALAAQVPVHEVKGAPDLQMTADTIVVDALLGTGLASEVREPVRGIIDAINASRLPVLAVDLPSGLCSDTGTILGAAVQADLTVTFIGRKAGMLEHTGSALCGTVVVDPLGLPAELYTQRPKPAP